MSQAKTASILTTPASTLTQNYLSQLHSKKKSGVESLRAGFGLFCSKTPEGRIAFLPSVSPFSFPLYFWKRSEQNRGVSSSSAKLLPSTPSFPPTPFSPFCFPSSVSGKVGRLNGTSAAAEGVGGRGAEERKGKGGCREGGKEQGKKNPPPFLPSRGQSEGRGGGESGCRREILIPLYFECLGRRQRVPSTSSAAASNCTYCCTIVILHDIEVHVSSISSLWKPNFSPHICCRPCALEDR